MTQQGNVPFTQSTAFSLAIGYVALGLVAIALFALPLWYSWRVIFRDWQMDVLREEAQRLSHIHDDYGAERLKAFLNERIGLRISGDRLLLLAGPNLVPLAGNIPRWPTEIPTEPGVYTLTLRPFGQPIKVVLIRARLAGGDNLLIARDVSHSGSVETQFWIGLAGSIGVLSAVGICGAFLVRRSVLSNINRISSSVSTIVEGDLSHRLPVGNRQSEFDVLSWTINRMFDQIEHLVSGVRNVSNAIAHDLRTPLTQLRAQLEKMAATLELRQQALPEIEAAVAEVDRVIDIFNALLRLAEIDSGAKRCGFAAVNLIDVVAGVIDFYQPVAEARGVTLTFCHTEPDIGLQGDQLLLTQALVNLLDNALKFLGSGGAVLVEVATRLSGMVEMTVADNGPGIPDSEKPRVIERFYRGDPSRGTTPGHGLGLSLVEAVARLHGGALLLTDNRPGLKAQILLGAGGPGFARIGA